MVCPVTADPPSPPLIQDSDADLLPAVALTPVGAAGTFAARHVMVLDCTDAGLVPTEVVAVTEMV